MIVEQLILSAAEGLHALAQRLVRAIKRGALLLDAHATKLLGAATAALAGADFTGIAGPLQDLIGTRGYDALLIAVAAATYARGHVTGARYRHLEARIAALEAQPTEKAPSARAAA